MAGDELDKFIADILEAKQLSGVDDLVRDQLISDLKNSLLDQINRALINALPEDKLDELNTMLEDDSVADEAVQQFIMDSGVNVQRVTVETMLAFRSLYLQTPEEREASNA